MASHHAYIRRSTFEQENEHQRQAIDEWLDANDVRIEEVEFLSETGSGASRNRSAFRNLLARIENDEVDNVVVWELSRIAREGQLAQEFFNLCEDHDVHVHVTSGSIREIKPDGTNRFVADILAAVYAEERRTLIRRTKYGQQRALRNDKWVGKPPLGFTTDADGYLIGNVEFYDDEYNPDRDGFYAIEAVIQAIDADDESLRSAASDLLCSRQAIASLYKAEDRRRWYLDHEADDDRVQRAIDELEG